MFVTNEEREIDAEDWAQMRVSADLLPVRSPRRLIALTGRMGAGKDSVAAYLAEEHGLNRLAFADPLKRALNTMFGWCDEDWSNRKWRETANGAVGGKTPRQAVISLGTAWGRALISEDVWIRPILEAVEQTRACEFVVSDVRFNNEATALKALGFEIWEVRRNWFEPPPPNKEPTEAGIDRRWIDRYVINDGSLQELEEEVDTLLESE